MYRAFSLVFQFQILQIQQLQQPFPFGRVVHISGAANSHRTNLITVNRDFIIGFITDNAE